MDSKAAKRTKRTPQREAWDEPPASSSWDNPPSSVPKAPPPPPPIQKHWDVFRRVEKNLPLAQECTHHLSFSTQRTLHGSSELLFHIRSERNISLGSSQMANGFGSILHESCQTKFKDRVHNNDISPKEQRCCQATRSASQHEAASNAAQSRCAPSKAYSRYFFHAPCACV